MGDQPEGRWSDKDPTDTIIFGGRKDPAAPNVKVLLTRTTGKESNYQTVVFIADAHKETEAWSVNLVNMRDADMDAIRGISLSLFASKVEQVPPGYRLWGWFD